MEHSAATPDEPHNLLELQIKQLRIELRAVQSDVREADEREPEEGNTDVAELMYLQEQIRQCERKIEDPDAN